MFRFGIKVTLLILCIMRMFSQCVTECFAGDNELDTTENATNLTFSKLTSLFKYRIF